jgi:WD40 repeat protein
VRRDAAAGKVLATFHEHTAEAYAVDWNLVNKENFLSGAWDNTIKLWHPSQAGSLRTFAEHKSSVYATIWHPKVRALFCALVSVVSAESLSAAAQNPDLFASASGDGTVKVWDCNDKKVARCVLWEAAKRCA